MKHYLDVLATPGAWRFLAPALLARLPYAMLQLGVLLLVEWSTGSYGAAGIAAAAAAVAQALVGPQTGKLADRFGQARVLLPQLIVHAVALGSLLLLAASRAAVPYLVLVAALAGATVPQVAAMVRARWSHTLSGSSKLGTAFAVESITDELTFTIAPMLLVALSTGFSPVVALLGALGLIVVGTAVFALVKQGAPEPMPVKVRASKGVLRARGVALLAAAFLATGAVFGSMQVGITAIAGAQAGTVYGTFSAASMAGGLLYGVIRWRVPLNVRLGAGLAILAAATTALSFADSTATLYGAAALAGVIIAPVVITGYTIIDSLVPAEVRTEAFTWLNGAIGLGIATGAAVAGQLVDRFGPDLAFVVPPLMTGLAAVLVFARMRSLTAAGIQDAAGTEDAEDLGEAGVRTREQTGSPRG
ncbi:MFS transporter [Nonomuraea sp. NPDC050663]|uniref:MFS transporter n=1 Tax=Nonomuraea sp. NPDC050663 TaxID=3364370 RepID=UPI0037B85253